MTTTETAADSVATGRLTTSSLNGLIERGLDVFGRRATADRRAWEVRYVRSLLVIDSGATLVATLVAFGLRFQGAQYANRYLLLSVLIPVFWVSLLALAHGYERRVLFVGNDEYRLVYRAGLHLTAGMAVLSYVLKADLARGYLFMVLVLTPGLSLLGRVLLRRRLHRARRRGGLMHRVLVLGHADAVARTTGELHRRYHHGFRVVGACLPAGQLGEPARSLDVPVIGELDMAATAAAAADADTVMVLSCPELDGPAVRRLAWELERDDIDLILSSSLVDTTAARITVRPMDGLPMMRVEHPRLSGVRRLVKDVVDVVVAAVLLALLSPVFLAVALVVKIDDGGPVLFRQQRVGRGGEPFQMYKFRTMHVHAERRVEAMHARHGQDGVLFKLPEDPRVTRSGRRLRRWSLDELPQLINVLRGEMSLVGPRPPLRGEVERYPQDMRRRLVVKPGMTGLWQVSGRSDLSWEDSMRLDLRYVENWSFGADLAILLRTVVVVCRGAGAY